MPYSILEAYRLGQQFEDQNNWEAAEVCYALPMIKNHPYNHPSYANAHINPSKLTNIIQHRKQINYKIPTKGRDMPYTCLLFIQSFYSPWLEHKIKPDMIVCFNIYFSMYFIYCTLIQT